MRIEIVVKGKYRYDHSQELTKSVVITDEIAGNLHELEDAEITEVKIGDVRSRLDVRGK